MCNLLGGRNKVFTRKGSKKSCAFEVKKGCFETLIAIARRKSYRHNKRKKSATLKHLLHFLGQGYLKGFSIFVNFLSALPKCVLKSFCLMRNMIGHSWIFFKSKYFRLSINVKILWKIVSERSNCHKIHIFVIWVFTDFWWKCTTVFALTRPW